jgi:hypothetical protein
MSIHLEHQTLGVATVNLGKGGRRLTYRVDPDTHRVTIHDDFGRLLFAFGGRGSGPAALDTPLDLTFVRPIFSGERLPVSGPDAVWLAVADYGNRRLQIFELDGAHVGAVELADQSGIGGPCALTWRPPVLEIQGVEGARARVYLSAALLCSTAYPSPTARPPREWRHARHLVN